MRRPLLLLTAVIVVLLAVLVWFYPSRDDFRAENPFWNGLKSFSERFQASSADSLDSLPSGPEGATLIVVPYLEFGQAELAELKHFVTLGGTLVLLDDYGHGNEILASLGLSPRLAEGTLLDPIFNYKNKWFPRVTRFAVAAIDENVESIVLNHGTTIADIPESQVVAWSSRFSFLDVNENAGWDEGEPKGPLPVAAVLPMNGGNVVLVSDPSILINGMEGIGDSYGFMESITAVGASDPEIILDQSHLPEAALDDAKGALATIRGWLSSSVGISGIVLMALVTALGPLWRRR